MRPSELRPAGPILMLCTLLVGCAPHGVMVLHETSVGVPLPLLLQGQNTRMRLVFPTKDQSVQPGGFQRNEVCYLKAGDFRIDCYNDGSSLNLGPNDSTTVLSDNPMWDVEPVDADKLAVKYMRLYGVLFLVGASVDRLPQTLGDYIADPGSHQTEAVALARTLLNSRHLQFEGFARGGSFTVLLELTDSGQDKLVEALDEAGETTGPTQLVSSHKLRPRAPHHARYVRRQAESRRRDSAE